MAEKGPLDRLNELSKRAAQLHAMIARGESGDGIVKPDLRAQLDIVEGEIKNLAQANRLFPTMNPEVQGALAGLGIKAR